MIAQIASYLYYRRQPAWRLYQGMLRTQYLDRGELQDLQLKKLARLIDHHSSRNEYWKKRLSGAGVSSAAVTSIADLQKLPVLEKGDLSCLRAEKTTAQGAIVKTTGGTTGQPVSILTSPRHVQWSTAAMLRFYQNWLKYSMGARRAKIFAAPTRMGIPEDSLRSGLRNRLSNTLFLDALQLTPDKTKRIIRELRRFKPKVLLGYTSCLHTVARMLACENESLGIVDLKIVNAAEPITPTQKECIEANMGGALYDHYGTREIGYIADECERRDGLHIHMEYLVVEIVDEQGNWVKEGEEGEILITELENRAMPVIRYRIGDRAVKTNRKCPCGRGLELIPAVIGRSTDVILLPNGNRLTGLAFPHLLKDFPIVEYQVVQRSMRLIEVHLVLEPNASHHTMPRIHSALQGIMPGVDLKVIPVDAIPRTSSGKLRSVISELGV